VNLLWAVLIILGVTVVTITAMLLVRRRAPAGSFFENGDRAAGVFGVLATGFAVLIGFVVFLAFESFDTSRSGGETEARVLAQQFETAQFLPEPAASQLSGELICYGRDVVHEEWSAMRSGTLSDGLNPWTVAMFHTLKTAEPRTPAEQAAYAKWLDQGSDRENARADRVHGAEGVIPSPLWIVLFVSAGAIFAFMLLFADSAEAAFVQATMMGALAIVLSSMFLLLWFLDNPYTNGIGGLKPVAMERTLGLLDQAVPQTGKHIVPPCDANGLARS